MVETWSMVIMVIMMMNVDDVMVMKFCDKCFFNRPLTLNHYMQNVKDGGKWKWTPVGVGTLIMQFSKRHYI